MKIRVLFFAKVREQIGSEELSIELDNVKAQVTVQTLINALSQKSKQWHDTLSDNSVKISVNHQLANQATVLSNNAEVAFFPPITGG